MPLRNSPISAAVTVTATTPLFGPPRASRSGLTPRDPADAIVLPLDFSRPSGFMPPSPNAPPPDFVPLDCELAGGADEPAGGATCATCETGTGLNEIDWL